MPPGTRGLSTSTRLLYLTGHRQTDILSPMSTITITGYLCDRCGHQWVPRGDPEQKPLVCPKCKSPYWNVPRKIKTRPAPAGANGE